jgi:diacylglycerol kinase (ATP)
MEPQAFTFTGRLRSFTHAARGIAMMLRSQHNAWVHAGATLAAIGAGVGLGLTRFEWCWIVLAIVGVWMAESLNTAFELLCDVASPQFHPIVKNAKDVAAGAVLISACGAFAVGLMIYVPHIRAIMAQAGG